MRAQKYFGATRAPPVVIMLTCLGMLAWLYPIIPIGNWMLSLICFAAIGFFTYGLETKKKSGQG